jgi:hypothetical protein
MAAPFYRRDLIEELEEKHPGLLKFVEERQRRRVPNPQIAAAVLDEWGEVVSEQVLSNHYTARVWPQLNLEAESFRRANEQAAIILKIAAENPELDEAKIAKVLLTQAIMETRADLADSDPLKLLAEQRKRLELEQHQQEIEIERERLEHDKKELELKVGQLERQHEREHETVKEAARDAAKDPKAALERILGIYNLGDLAGRGTAPAVPGPVGA